jgi:hypothetical protein
VLGPNTQVAQGEATNCLLGPFVGFHHQALLISALWPEGRGNIAYGANVGSNHTGRKPDQEFRPGEGNFFGLGCWIKYPSDYSEAPYSLFSTGLLAEPQKLSFPFSLVVPAREAHVSGAHEIRPAWSWTDNRYALFRNGIKYRERDRSKHHTLHAGLPTQGLLAYSFFSLRVVRLVLMAQTQLAQALSESAGSTGSSVAVFDSRSLPGLGYNRLARKHAVKALAGYEDYLIFWRLLTGLSLRSDAHPEGSHLEYSDLSQEIFGVWPGLSESAFLEKAKASLSGFRAALLTGLERDEARGKEIQSDYGLFHPDSSADPVVKRVLDEVERLQQGLEDS